MYFRSNRKEVIKKARRIVIKIGSAVLAGDLHSGVDESLFSNLAKDISHIIKDKRKVILVSSGAIAIGMKRLGLKEKVKSIPEKQAVAAVGQGSLMALYEKVFSPLKIRVAQVLLTHDDLSDRHRFLNAKNTLQTLLEYNAIPIINENDTVAVDEIKFGDNDNLSALLTNLVEADLLVILTDINGLYNKDPKINKDAELIPVVDDIDKFISVAGRTLGIYGTGGMQTKLDAAKKAAHFGVPTIVANGREKNILKKIFSGNDIGTLFLPMEERLTSRKHWLAFSTRPAGSLILDDGAKNALLKKGKSLLSSGIIGIEGNFDSGDAVSCVSPNGKEIARGIVNYSSDELKKIKGLKTSEIEKALGYKYFDEVIHRDNLVIQEREP
ncbi:MAG: glutamate 5-kinase [Nitrospirae bacterium]|nr:glutamate 5-kinase [Nitrospirota bacterium]